jgi:S1-C subfamily serine protease
MGAVNIIDLVLVLAFLGAAARGYRQGALSQVAAFAGLVLGLVIGAAAAPGLAARLVGQPGRNLALATFGLLMVSLLAGQAIGLAGGARLRAAMRSTGIATADRVAGIGVGVVSLALAVWLLGSALVSGPVPEVARQVASSRVVTAIGQALPPAPNLFARAGAYLQRQGFPQVFAVLGDRPTAAPVAPPDEAGVRAAQEAAALSTVQVTALGCGAVSAGSGFVTAPGFVVTNAHVVAGGQSLTVTDRSGTVEAVAVLVDPVIDLAVLAAPGLAAPPIPFVDAPAARGTAGATLGYPGGGPDLVVRPAAVTDRVQAVGRDVYGRDLARREVLTLSAAVAEGDSGGPFVTSDRRVGGVVFAAAATEQGIGYALTAEQVADDVAAAVAGNTPVGTGECRF